MGNFLYMLNYRVQKSWYIICVVRLYATRYWRIIAQNQKPQRRMNRFELVSKYIFFIFFLTCNYLNDIISIR